MVLLGLSYSLILFEHTCSGTVVGQVFDKWARSQIIYHYVIIVFGYETPEYISK